jgi:hypothetical protein
VLSGQEVAGKKMLLRRLVNTLKNCRILYMDENLVMLDQLLVALQAKLEWTPSLQFLWRSLKASSLST